MAGSSAEDFWNNSSGGRFNFDDDEQEKLTISLEYLQPINRQSVFRSIFDEENVLSIVPIHSLVSKGNLDAVLDDLHLPLQSIVPSIQETILKMFLGMPYILGMYKSLDQKLALLDEAILTEDGNIILGVLLYIRKTLKLSKLFHYLVKRKIAFQHYVRYLMVEFNLEELTDLYMYSRNYSDIVYLFYLESKHISSKETMLLNLSKFLHKHQSKLDRHKEFLFLELKSFLMWQMESCFPCGSVIDQLAKLCKLEWTSNRENKIIEFKQLLKLSDFQYEWTALNVLCALQMWQKLFTVFIKPNWLTKKNSFKSVINIQLFISTLYGHEPPKKILEEFLNCMSDSAESLMLAKKMLCYKFVIDLYLLQRDRQSIIIYKECIPHQFEEYFYAESVIQALDKKWKN